MTAEIKLVFTGKILKDVLSNEEALRTLTIGILERQIMLALRKFRQAQVHLLKPGPAGTALNAERSDAAQNQQSTPLPNPAAQQRALPTQEGQIAEDEASRERASPSAISSELAKVLKSGKKLI